MRRVSTFPWTRSFTRIGLFFLHKPVTYSLHKHSDTPLAVSEQWKGLLISHRTSDPERAVPAVKTLFPSSIYYDDLDVRLEQSEEHPRS